MKPSDLYSKQCAEGVISYDAWQVEVLSHFDRLYEDLLKEVAHRISPLSFLKKRKTVRGIYLWGKVGTGKTTLMDAFYTCLPFPKKTRMHFHHFMAMIHDELKLHQGKKNPLQKVADDIASSSAVICFDEFAVSDITDAMLLGGLFEALFARGVCLVATSNTPPDRLYYNGLQRERFLPVIERIKLNTDVLFIPSEIDYRLQYLSEAGAFFTPLNDDTRIGMRNAFAFCVNGAGVTTDPITVRGRDIPVIAKSNDVVWFEFKAICSVPRSQKDYLEIADRFRTVLVSNIPVISPDEKNMICLFVSLVDVFYDARIKLVISAEEPVSELYRKGFMTFEYARTQSRLLEMQSPSYYDSES